MHCFRRNSIVSIGRTLTIAAFAAMTLAPAQPAQAQTYTVLHSFSGAPDGAFPSSPLTSDGAGNYYGTTQSGGAYDKGTIFKVDTSGRVTVAYSFTGGTDGAAPAGRLIFHCCNGAFYGVTTSGGDSTCQCGTIYQFDPGVNLPIWHVFTGRDNGYSPSGMVSINTNFWGVASGGKGTACNGGPCGVVFKFSGDYSVKHRFTGGTDGGFPGELSRDEAGDVEGNMYSATTYPSNGGLFKIDKLGRFTSLFTFPGGAGGSLPGTPLLIDANDNIRGETAQGGDTSCASAGCGVVYEVDAAGNETVLHTFHTFRGGVAPEGGLLDDDGALYGTTNHGGYLNCAPGCGVLFEISNTGQYSVLHFFRRTDGALPDQKLTLDTNGAIYGVTSRGGTGTAGECNTDGCGVVFKYTPAVANETEVNP